MVDKLYVRCCVPLFYIAIGIGIVSYLAILYLIEAMVKIYASDES
jgi:hypothetical protein